MDFAIIKGYDTSLDGTPFKDCSNLRIVILPAKKYTKDIFLGCPKLELVSAFCPNPKPLAIASDEDAPFTLILTGNDEKAIEALQQFRKAQLKEERKKQTKKEGQRKHRTKKGRQKEMKEKRRKEGKEEGAKESRREEGRKKGKKKGRKEKKGEMEGRESKRRGA